MNDRFEKIIEFLLLAILLLGMLVFIGVYFSFLNHVY